MPGGRGPVPSGEGHDSDRGTAPGGGNPGTLGEYLKRCVQRTFAFQLAEATGPVTYELERRLGHRSQRYIARYTNPPKS